MKSHVQVAVIGGGVVGCSVLYHLTKLGWTDVAIVERDVLTAGSSWHAAGNGVDLGIYPGGCHVFQGFPTAQAEQSLLQMDAFLKRMIEAKKGGRIINLSSKNGFVAEAHLAAYNASKGGLELLTQTLASNNRLRLS